VIRVARWGGSDGSGTERRSRRETTERSTGTIGNVPPEIRSSAPRPVPYVPTGPPHEPAVRSGFARVGNSLPTGNVRRASRERGVSAAYRASARRSLTDTRRSPVQIRAVVGRREAPAHAAVTPDDPGLDNTNYIIRNVVHARRRGRLWSGNETILSSVVGSPRTVPLGSVRPSGAGRLPTVRLCGFESDHAPSGPPRPHRRPVPVGWRREPPRVEPRGFPWVSRTLTSDHRPDSLGRSSGSRSGRRRSPRPAVGVRNDEAVS
jgi:hypothetical protein